MHRRLLVAGNWKMHGLQAQTTALINQIKQAALSFTAIDVLICPTFIHLYLSAQLLADTAIHLGAQNMYLGDQGAFTGEVSGVMLKEIGCQYVLIGHSERRQLFHENLELITAKVKSALHAQLIPILCVGETQTERKSGLMTKVLHQQLQSVIDGVGIESFGKCIIAYEPIWAIGTGNTATPEQAQMSHEFIRDLIAQNNVDLAKTMRILYGGSIKADNAAQLFAMPDVDGGLVGNASLEFESFSAICRAAIEVKTKDDRFEVLK